MKKPNKYKRVEAYGGGNWIIKNHVMLSADDIVALLIKLEEEIASNKKRAMPAKSQKKAVWISVRERLPNDVFDWVLVRADGVVDCFGYNKNKGFHNPMMSGRDTPVEVEDITEWAEIP